MSFVATWMDLDMIILSEVSQTEKGKYHAFMWDLKKKVTNELIYKTKTDSKTSKTHLWSPEERCGGVG